MISKSLLTDTVVLFNQYSTTNRDDPNYRANYQNYTTPTFLENVRANDNAIKLAISSGVTTLGNFRFAFDFKHSRAYKYIDGEAVEVEYKHFNQYTKQAFDLQESKYFYISDDLRFAIYTKDTADYFDTLKVQKVDSKLVNDTALKAVGIKPYLLKEVDYENVYNERTIAGLGIS